MNDETNTKGDGLDALRRNAKSPKDAEAFIAISTLLGGPKLALGVSRIMDGLCPDCLERGTTLVEVPDEEFDTMGTNVLALAPRRCLMLAGNPRTRTALERAGAEVTEYEGREISVKGAGGPTCLTRPLRRLV
jgi:N-dimethylarginine dimethylaminohydrolase